MNYSLYVDQKKTIQRWLSLKEWVVFDYITKAPKWANWKEIDWEIYYNLYRSKMCEDLPSVTESKSTMNNYIKSLVEKWLLVRYIFNNNSPHYKISEKWKDWGTDKYQGGEPSVIGGWAKNATGGEPSVAPNQSTNNQSTNNQIKNNKKSLESELTSFIEKWNSVNEVKHSSWKKIKWFQSCIKITPSLIDEYIKIRTKHKLQVDDVSHWMKQYLIKLKTWDVDWSHRYSLYEFFKRWWWLLTYYQQNNG